MSHTSAMCGERSLLMRTACQKSVGHDDIYNCTLWGGQIRIGPFPGQTSAATSSPGIPINDGKP